MSASENSILLAVKIESIGAAASNKLYRFSSGPVNGAWDTSGVYIEGLHLFPNELETSVDFLNFDATAGSLSVTINASYDVTSKLYTQVPEQIATLTEALTSTTDNTIKLDDTGLAGTAILIEREVIILGSYVSTQYTSCTRGALETAPDTHDIQPADDISVFDAATGPLLYGRRITLLRVNDATAGAYSDEETLWSGFITDVSAPAPHLISINADSILQFCRGRKILNDMPEVTPLTSAGITSWKFDRRAIAQTRNSSASLDISFENGKWLGTNMRASAGAISYLVYRGVISSSTGVDSTWVDITPLGDDRAKFKSGHQCFICDNTDTTDTSSLPLSANCISLALQILTTTSTGKNFDSSGAVGAYDVGERRLGIAIPWNAIDIAQFESVRDDIGDIAWRTNERMQGRLFLGLKKNAINAFEYINRVLLGPLGLTLAVDNAGQLIIAQLLDSQDLATLTSITSENIVVPPLPVQTKAIQGGVDRVDVSYDLVIGRGAITDTFENIKRRRRAPFGDTSVLSLNLESIPQTRVGFAASLAAQLAARYTYPIPITEIKIANTSGSMRDIKIGDLVKVTHDKLYKVRPAGGVSKGLTDAMHLVSSRRANLNDGTISLRLLYVGNIYDAFGVIAPAAKINTYNNTTRIFALQTGTDRFNNDQSDGTGFSVGSKLLVTTRQHVDRLGGNTLEIEEIAGGGDNIKVTSASHTTLVSQLGADPACAIAAGDLLSLPLYDSALAADQTKKIFMGDTNNTLGSGGVTAYQWSF